MVYAFFKVLMSFILRVYLRKIESYGLNTVPARGPLIVSSNHPNALLDAVIVAVMLKRKLHFLSRADVFNSPFKRRFFSLLGIIPVYRIRDGRENLDKNKQVFAHCYDILDEGGAILIFSEGSCVVEKHLRPLKPGTAQLATGFYGQYKQPVSVTCIGLTYSDPFHFRTKVKLSCSEPIPVTKPPESKDIMELTALFRVKIMENMVHVDERSEEKKYEPVERYEEAKRYRFGWHIRLPVRPPEFKLIEDLQKQAHEQVHSVSIEKRRSVFGYMLLILGFPAYVVGYVFNLPVKIFVLKLVKANVKGEEFIASVKMAGGAVIWAMYCILVGSILIIGDTNLYILGIFMICSYLAVVWRETNNGVNRRV